MHKKTRAVNVGVDVNDFMPKTALELMSQNTAHKQSSKSHICAIPEEATKLDALMTVFPECAYHDDDDYVRMFYSGLGFNRLERTWCDRPFKDEEPSDE